MVMLVKLLQKLNAPSPIDNTEEGIAMLVKLLQKLNAISPMDVTEEGME